MTTAAAVYPYALLQPNPTTAVGISWIDATGDGGGPQTIRYGQVDDDLEHRERDAGRRLTTTADVYVYHTQLTGLDPGSRYAVEIEASETVCHAFETLPAERPDTIRIGVTSDHHPWREGIGMAAVGRGPAVMEAFGELEYDLIISPGDWLTHTFDGTASDADDWLRWWAEYGRPMDQSKLHPRFVVPGNHEIAANIPHTWNGRKVDWDGELLSPDAGHFQQLYPNLKALEPVGENYGAITVGDYLQLVGLDSYSAFPADQTEWLEETIDETVDHCIPVHHTPLLPGASRGGDELNQTVREAWARPLYEARNTSFSIVGDNHCRKYTYPWRVVDAQPDHESWLDLGGDGYLVVDETDADPRRMYEYGDGWPNARTADPTDGNGKTVTWYLEYTEYENVDETQFHTVEISSSDDAETVLVREWDQWGNELQAHTVRGTTPDQSS